MKRIIEHSNPEVMIESLSLFLKDGWKIMNIDIVKGDGFNVYTCYLEK